MKQIKVDTDYESVIFTGERLYASVTQGVLELRYWQYQTKARSEPVLTDKEHITCFAPTAWYGFTYEDLDSDALP